MHSDAHVWLYDAVPDIWPDYFTIPIDKVVPAVFNFGPEYFDIHKHLPDKKFHSLQRKRTPVSKNWAESAEIARANGGMRDIPPRWRIYEMGNRICGRWRP